MHVWASVTSHCIDRPVAGSFFFYPFSHCFPGPICLLPPVLHTSRNTVYNSGWSFVGDVFCLICWFSCFTESVNYNSSEAVTTRLPAHIFHRCRRPNLQYVPSLSFVKVNRSDQIDGTRDCTSWTSWTIITSGSDFGVIQWQPLWLTGKPPFYWCNLGKVGPSQSWRKGVPISV